MDLSRLRLETSLQQIQWFDETDSTSTRAIEAARDPSIETPYLIGADRQTAGRGRGSNRWWGTDGALMFSVGLSLADLGLAIEQWPRFSLVTGLAVAETISHFLPRADVGLKWPNDIWIGQKKVCGILIEQAVERPSGLIVGIGINVNNSFALAPAEQQQIATSMRDVLDGESLSRTEILIDFLNRWDLLAAQLANDSLNLAERWSHSCVLSGRAVSVTAGSDEKTGICAGIDCDGSLLLRTAYTTERCYAGTVRLLSE